MRILFLTSRLPYPPNRGDRLRVYNFMKKLSVEHELHLVSFTSRRKESQYVEKLKPLCTDINIVERSNLSAIISILLSWWKPVPLQVLYYQSRKMQQLIDNLLTTHQFDAAYIHLFRMAPYLENSQGLYRILDLTDAISREIARSLRYRNLLNRLLYSIEYPRIYRYERSVANHFDETWLITESDRQAIITDCPGKNIQVISNGIDTDKFHPTDIQPNPYTILFTGHFGVAHNIDAAIFLAKRILPRIQQIYPDCMLYLVGAEPVPEVRKLDILHGVNVTGFVEDLNLFLNQAAVFVAPLRFSTGMQNKVLEAMAAARPVITTSNVNEGLGAINGQEVIIADDLDEIVRNILYLFDDPEISRTIGRSGYEFVTRHYNWNYVLERINIISKTINRS